MFQSYMKYNAYLSKVSFFLNQNNQPVHVSTYDKENGSVCPVYGLKGTGAK